MQTCPLGLLKKFRYAYKRLRETGAEVTKRSLGRK